MSFKKGLFLLLEQGCQIACINSAKFKVIFQQFLISPGQVFASLPKTVRGAPTLLKGDPKGKNFLYTNGKSVFIRDIEVSWVYFPCISDLIESTVSLLLPRATEYASHEIWLASNSVTGRIL